MRYVTFSTAADPAPRLGVLGDDAVIDLGASAASEGRTSSVPGTLLDLVRAGSDAWERARARAEEAHGHGALRVPVVDVRLHAPMPRPPRNVFCLGLNYLAHAHESSRARGREVKIPTVPVFFTKASTAVTGPGEPVLVDPAVTSQVDWEVELGVVIGIGGRDIARADAMRHVFGYTAINDLSARDLQAAHLQWFKGKSLDGFCPMGPVVVTADEFGDPQRKRLQSRVNGVAKQDALTSDMIFPIDVIIESLSRGMTLEPGDIIATGTPEGVGMGRTPPEFLGDGDVVEVEVEGIGILRNQIVVRGAAQS